MSEVPALEALHGPFHFFNTASDPSNEDLALTNDFASGRCRKSNGGDLGFPVRLSQRLNGLRWDHVVSCRSLKYHHYFLLTGRLLKISNLDVDFLYFTDDVRVFSERICHQLF